MRPRHTNTHAFAHSFVDNVVYCGEIGRARPWLWRFDPYVPFELAAKQAQFMMGEMDAPKYGVNAPK